MRVNNFVLSVALTGLLCAPAFAEAAEESPAIVKLRTVDTDVSPDGLYTRTFHMEILATNAASAMEVGQQSIPFNETMEDLEVIEAYTIKAAGEKIPVGPNAIYTQQSQGSAQFPLFDDQRQKVIVFPSVAAGDTIAYTVRWRIKQARIPGQFTTSSYYSKAVAYEEVREMITAPKSFPLQVENHDVDFTKQDMGDKVAYRWHYSAPKPSLDDPPPVSPLDQMPRFHVSSFKDYDSFGQTFAAIFVSKEAITPRIQMLADSLTNGISDHRQQAKAIYEWVSKNIRYVAVDIGNGGIVPHDADSVLANAYGDCKDHTVLFSTLLKAKGIQSEAVLINLGKEYALTGVPTGAPMNHAITWLPEFNLYADTTAGTAPFGVLPFEEYGKPVIHAVARAPARHQTPVLAPEVASINLKTMASLDKDGQVTGNTIVTAQGPFSILLRAEGLAIQGTGPQRAAAALLQRQGLVGTGSFDVPPPSDLNGGYAVQSNFSFGPKPEYVSGVRFDIVRGMSLTTLAGDYLMGPLFNEKLKETEPTACFSGRIVEEMTLQAPQGRQFTSPPRDLELRTSNLQFSAHWATTKDSVTLRQEFVSKLDRPLCDAAVRRETARTLADIRRHYQFDLISLVPSGSALGIGADGMLRGAESAVKDKDWPGAIRLYTAAIAALGPDKPNLAKAYNARAQVYRNMGDQLKAVADFTQSLNLQPDMYGSLVDRGTAYTILRRWERADADFKQAIQLRANLVQAYDARAYSYLIRGLLWRAVEDCDTAIRLAPRTTLCYAYRGRIRYLIADFEHGIADGTEAIRIQPAESGPHVNRGLNYLALAQYGNAVADFDEAIKLSPRNTDALFARGVAKIRLGQEDAGDADIDAAKKIEANVAFRMAGFGVSTSVFVPGVDDLAACKTARATDSTQAIVFCTRALSAANLSDEEKATVYGMLGLTTYVVREYDQTIAYLDEALRLHPGNAEWLAGRGISYDRKGDKDQAVRDLDAAAKFAPDNASIFLYRGEFQARNGAMEAAVVEFAQALRIDANHISAYMARADVYEQMGQFDKAIADMDAAIRLSPSPYVYSARCNVLALADRLTAAMADCEKALLQAPNDFNALSARGLIYLKLGQDMKAADDFNRALKINPGAKVAYYGLGVLKLRSGDRTGDDDIAEATLLDADFVARMRRRGLKP
jgi:tetratricopeptide (TPR) repeat protein/transglutaminase-like putative cysteine protease